MICTIVRSSDNIAWCELSLEVIKKKDKKTPFILSDSPYIDIHPLDSRAQAYALNNWLSGALSGAQFGLSENSSLHDYSIKIIHIKGELRCSDITGIAVASYFAIKNYFNKCSSGEAEGWKLVSVTTA